MKEAAAAAIHADVNQYAITWGAPNLRHALARKYREHYGMHVDTETEITITCGGTEAMASVMLAVVDPGDEVIVMEPFYENYGPDAVLCEAKPVFVTLEAPEYRLERAMLEEAVSNKTRAIVINTPNNPTGRVFDPEEMQAIADICVEHDILAITDEIYEHLVYGDNEFHSIATLCPELGDKVIVLNGVAKTYAMTGWRVGWMIGPADLIKAAQNLQSHSTSNVANVAQAAALAAVAGPLDAVHEMRSAFDRRRRTMHSMLSSIDGVLCPEPEGAFYAYPDFSALLGREIRGHRVETTLDLADVLLEQAKVAIVPGEAFGVGGGARLSFALGDDDLAEGVGRIVEFLS